MKIVYLLVNVTLVIRQLANFVRKFANGEYTISEILNWRNYRDSFEVISVRVVFSDVGITVRYHFPVLKILRCL